MLENTEPHRGFRLVIRTFAREMTGKAATVCIRYAPLRLAARRQPTPQQLLQRQQQGQRQQKNTTAPPCYRRPDPISRFATRCKSKIVRSESPQSTSQFQAGNRVSPYFGGFRQPFTASVIARGNSGYRAGKSAEREELR